MLEETVLGLFEEAKKNNGLINIIMKSNDIKEQEGAIDFHFNHMLSNQYYLVSPLTISKTKTLTKKKKDYIKRIVINKKGAYFINIYEMLDIEKKYQTIETLSVFENLFQKARDYFVIHNYKFNFKLLYETNPMRVVPSIGFPNPENTDRLIINEKITKEFEVLFENEHLKKWSKFLANNIRTLGRWSWVNIMSEGFLTRKEKRAFYKKEDDEEE
jgi:hypothetical protein